MGKVRSAFGVVAVGCVLSMVISTGVVGAAVAKAQDVFVTNDDTHSVPVHSVGTSQVAGTVDVGNFPAATPVLTEMTRRDWVPGEPVFGTDVARFGTVRLSVIAGTDCTSTPGPTQRVTVQEGRTARVLDSFEISYPADGGAAGVNRIYEVPGENLTIFGPSACHAAFILWGRP